MNPNTANLIVFAEQMAALLAKTIADIRSVISGTGDPTAILNDADATYQQIIANAKQTPQTPPTT